MQAEDTGKAYDQITDLWTSTDFDIENGVDAHYKALDFAGSSGLAMELGCGCTDRHARAIEGDGLSLTRMDISASMLAIAREIAPQFEYVHADFSDWHGDGAYTFISAWDSLWHIPLDRQERVVRNLAESLTVGGVLLLSFGGLDSAGEHIDDSMGPDLYYASIGINNYIRILIEDGCVIRHFEFDQFPEKHAYLIAQKV